MITPHRGGLTKAIFMVNSITENTMESLLYGQLVNQDIRLSLILCIT